MKNYMILPNQKNYMIQFIAGDDKTLLLFLKMFKNLNVSLSYPKVLALSHERWAGIGDISWTLSTATDSIFHK